MSWVCPVCSTNNEETENKCIVCDSERVSDKICTLTFNKVQKLGLSGHVVVPPEFNVIGEGAFKGRTDIYSVTLHNNVRKISKEAFSGCSNLSRISYSAELDSIGMKAFADCTLLPISERVKARYVAKDAYYITPKTEPVRKSSSESYRKEETHYYYPVRKSVRSYWRLLDTPAIISHVVLAICAILSIVNNCLFAVSDTYSLWCYIILLCVVCLVCKVINLKFKEDDTVLYVESNTIIKLTFLVEMYLANIKELVFAQWYSVLIFILFLLSELVAFIIAKSNKEYARMIVSVAMIAVNIILLVIIFA